MYACVNVYMHGCKYVRISTYKVIRGWPVRVGLKNRGPGNRPRTQLFPDAFSEHFPHDPAQHNFCKKRYQATKTDTLDS